jgi:hypothetical protein
VSLAALLLAVTAAAAPSPAQPPVREVDQRAAPIRCRPAPYYVADGSHDRMRMERILVTGSRIPVREIDRRPRPCLLMRTLDVPTQSIARIAD